MKTYNNITLYEEPKNYMGADFYGYYTILSKHRDSDCLTRANFDAMLNALGGESTHSNGVIVTRASHWAVGYIDTIRIHSGASKKLKVADAIICRLANYPVVDEDLWSQYEDEAKNELYFSCFNLRDRIKECVRAGLSIFAARHDSIPDRVYESLEV